MKTLEEYNVFLKKYVLDYEPLELIYDPAKRTVRNVRV